MPDRHIWPVSPPPEVDLDAWERTIDELELRAPERLALIHFGVVDQPRDHLRRLRRQLRLWGQRVRQGMDEDEFVEAARADLEEDLGEASYYERAARSGSRSGGSGATGTRRPRRALVVADHPLRRKALFDVPAARPDRARPPARGLRPSAVVVDDDPAHPVSITSGTAPTGRDHRRPARHRLDHDEAERLLPLDREERRPSILEQLDLLAVRDLAEVFDPAVADVRLDELREVLPLLRLAVLAAIFSGSPSSIATAIARCAPLSG